MWSLFLYSDNKYNIFIVELMWVGRNDTFYLFYINFFTYLTIHKTKKKHSIQFTYNKFIHRSESKNSKMKQSPLESNLHYEKRYPINWPFKMLLDCPVLLNITYFITHFVPMNKLKSKQLIMIHDLSQKKMCLIYPC